MIYCICCFLIQTGVLHLLLVIISLFAAMADFDEHDKDRSVFHLIILLLMFVYLAYMCRVASGWDRITFLPMRRYASPGLCDSDVSVCLSVRLSVCHTPVLCLAERKQDREMYTI